MLNCEAACETCGIVFVRLRSDARFCSSACRQRAYRARGADWKRLVADPKVRADLKEMGTALPEEFEEALAAARGEGDLSRRNVIDKIIELRVLRLVTEGVTDIAVTQEGEK